MSATQTTTTTTTRKWKDKSEKKKGNSVAKAYKAQVSKAKEPKQRRCPTCGRPL